MTKALLPLLPLSALMLQCLALATALQLTTAEEEVDTVPTWRRGRDSYLDAYAASHASAAHEQGHYAAPAPAPAPAPSYGPPRGYPPPSHHPHHTYGVYATAPDYQGEPQQQGGDQQGSGGVDVVSFMHALGKVLVVKIIVKLVAVIFALLFLPKIKEKKRRRPMGNKPHHRPQQGGEDDDDDEEEDDDEEDDDDDRRATRWRRSMRRLVSGFGTGPWDPRLLELADRVLTGIDKWTPELQSGHEDSLPSGASARTAPDGSEPHPPTPP